MDRNITDSRFLDFMESQGKTLPRHIKKEFDAYLKCGKLEQGFLRVRCEDCHHERLVSFSCKNAVSAPVAVPINIDIYGRPQNVNQ